MAKILNSKPITEIQREEFEKAQELNIDLYEAVAGLYEELVAANEKITALEERINTLTEGGAK